MEPDGKKNTGPTGSGIFHHHKSTKIDSQLEQVYESFYSKPQTMKECDVSIGVMRSNICWHCRTLRKHNRLFIVERRLCQITKHMANVYTTNPSLASEPENSQLNLF